MRKKYNLFIESLPVPLKRQEEYCKEYRCEEKSFANGGFGSVFRGYRVNYLTDVVIKKMRKSDVYQWGIVNGYRLPLEYCLMNDVLGKDNVIQILDAFDCGDNYVLVMESLKRCLPLDELITTTLDESFITKIVPEHCRWSSKLPLGRNLPPGYKEVKHHRRFGLDEAKAD